MKKIALAIAIFAIAGITNAMEFPSSTLDILALERATMGQASINGMLDWKVGETADYTLNMAFGKGTMAMVVREEITEGFWLDQNISLMGQTMKVEILIDKNTGEVLQIIANGEKQEVPKQNVEIVETKEANITVPKGTFDCIYVRIKDLDKNEESELWVNPQAVPIMGMIKTIQPSQMGAVTLELTNFRDL